MYQVGPGITADIFDHHAGWIDKITGDTIPPYTGNELMTLTFREPVGVVAAIIPWNAPLFLFAQKVAPALATGCTVVVKPSEYAALAILRLTEIIDGGGPAARGAERGAGPGPDDRRGADHPSGHRQGQLHRQPRRRPAHPRRERRRAEAGVARARRQERERQLRRRARRRAGRDDGDGHGVDGHVRPGVRDPEPGAGAEGDLRRLHQRRRGAGADGEVRRPVLVRDDIGPDHQPPPARAGDGLHRERT